MSDKKFIQVYYAGRLNHISNNYDATEESIMLAGLEAVVSHANSDHRTMTFNDLRRLRQGIYHISFEEFCEVLNKSIEATPDYAATVWTAFQDHPLQYMDSRQPQIQGEMLFELAWEKGMMP